MKVDFSEIIRFAYTQTFSILFKPFQFRKWIIWGIIALLSGQLSLGGNFPTRGLPQRPQTPSLQGEKVSKTKTAFIPCTLVLAQETAQAPSSSPNILQGLIDSMREKGIPSSLVGILFALVAIAISLFLLLMWLGSVFYFVFIENLIRNETEIKLPFRNNWKIGTSYFGWNLTFGTAGALLSIGLIARCFFLLKNAGVINDIENVSLGTVLGIVLPSLAAFFLILVVFSLIHFAVQNFATLILYKERCGILLALKKTLELIRLHLKDVLFYLLLCIAFGLLAGVIMFAIVFILIIFLLVTFGFLALITGFVIRLLPPPGDVILNTITILGGIASVLIFALIGPIFFLPIPVFFRFFNIKFVGVLEPAYDLLDQKTG